MKKILWTAIVLSVCVSCQSLPSRYENLPIGAKKGLVLSELGNPDHHFRKHDADHWIYLFPVPQGEPAVRELTFKDGKVIKKEIHGKPKDSDFVPVE